MASSESNPIGRLSTEVAGKIRGSVVAPSLNSAVVELVFNALDAGSTKILVQVDVANMTILVGVPAAAPAVEDFAARMTFPPLFFADSDRRKQAHFALLLPF